MARDKNQVYFQYILGKISSRTALEQLAEESAELSQAALKYIRAVGITIDNPTDTDPVEAGNNLAEEIEDVLLCIDIVKGKLNYAKDNPKLERWAKRLYYWDE